MKYLTCTRTDAPGMVRLINALTGLPKRGTLTDGKPDPRSPATNPNPLAKQGPYGWTTRHVDPVRHPANTGAETDQFAFPVTAEMQAAWTANKSKLTAADRAFVQAALTAAADLASEWRKTDADPTVGDYLDDTEDIEPEVAGG